MPFTIPTQLANDIYLLLGYAMVGAAIKYIDEAFDSDAYDKGTATLLAVPTAAIMAALMIYDPTSASIMLAIILASAAAHKIDNNAFKILMTLALLITALTPNLRMPWLPFVTLALAALMDEYGNDWSDQRRKNPIPNTRQTTLHQILETHLQYRPLLPLTALLLTLTNQLPPINLAGLILFDLAYHTTDAITHHKPKKTRHKTLQMA